ncbi:unnamed protein product [Closterium sp. NIES-53]
MASRHRRVISAAVVLSAAEQQQQQPHCAAADKTAAHMMMRRATTRTTRTTTSCTTTNSTTRGCYHSRHGSLSAAPRGPPPCDAHALHITQGPSVARPLAGIITGCCQDHATSPPPCEAVQVKAAPLRISRAAAAAAAAAATEGEASAARAATATSLGAARQTQHHQHDEQRMQRHHHHLRIMPPNASGCPVPPRPAHSLPASRSFPRSTSLPLWKLTPATHSPPLFTPSFPSSPVSAAAPASSSPPSSVSASAKESSSSANPNHNQHSQSVTVVRRPGLIRRYSAPVLRPNLSDSHGTSPISSPKANHTSRFESIADQLSSSESEGPVRLSLSPKRSCLSPNLAGESSNCTARRRLVRRVSFSGIVQVRRVIDLHADADKYCSDTDGRYSNAIYSGQWCGDAIPCCKREQQQQQQNTSPDSYTSLSASFNSSPSPSQLLSSPPSSSTSLSPSASTNSSPLVKPHPPPPRNCSHSSLTSLCPPSPFSCSTSHPHACTGMLPSPATRRLIARLRASAAASAAAPLPARQTSEHVVTASRVP